MTDNVSNMHSFFLNPVAATHFRICKKDVFGQSRWLVTGYALNKKGVILAQASTRKYRQASEASGLAPLCTYMPTVCSITDDSGTHLWHCFAAGVSHLLHDLQQWLCSWQDLSEQSRPGPLRQVVLVVLPCNHDQAGAVLCGQRCVDTCLLCDLSLPVL